MTNLVESHSLFEIDHELDDPLDQIEEQVEPEKEPSEELLSRFREFCAAHGGKVDRIGRVVRMMEAREQHCRAEASRLVERARSTAAKVDRTKSMVLFYLMSRELRKVEGREFTLRIQKNSQNVEKLVFCTNGLKSGDRKCLSGPRQSLVGHPDAMNFPRVLRG